MLDIFDDYEQLLRMQSSIQLPEPINFDIAKLVRNALQRARDLYPEHPHVSLNVSLQPFMQHEWLGQPKLLVMLLQHLLQIALGRTHHGAVCLRLGVEERNTSAPMYLTFTLEDSGPSLPRWQLDQWLSGTQESLLNTKMTKDISWIMAGHLIRHLGGSATAEMDPSTGLRLTGSLPIAQPRANAKGTVLTLTRTAPGRLSSESERPLLLVVEDVPEKYRKLKQLFEALDCRMFIVHDHAQAMVWAPVLPFSALILNGALPDARSMVVKRLQHLAQENLMPNVPIWAMVSALTVAEEKHWHQEGVHTLLIQPLKRAMLELLCTVLPLPDEGFYRAYDAQLQDDFPASIVPRLPELDHEIGKQLQQLQERLRTLPDSSKHPVVAYEAHAVKSASLSLGYYRLAALMAEIEHALTNDSFSAMPEHWQIIADALDPGIFILARKASA